MKRLAVFVHFDKDGIVDPYVEFYLQSLKMVVETIVFVTTSFLDDESRHKAKQYCYHVIERDNIGYDFMSYKRGLTVCPLEEYDEVLICNDSVYGPFSPLDKLMEKMSMVECDYWGMTESFQFTHHLQSYFLLFKRKAFLSEAFVKFWNNVGVIESKADLIREYEIGLSVQLQQAGLVQATAFSIDDEKKEARKKMFTFIFKGEIKKARNVKKRCHDGGGFACNQTLLFWDVLIRNNGMPFLKTAVLTHNAFGSKEVEAYQDFIPKAYPLYLIHNHQKRIKS